DAMTLTSQQTLDAYSSIVGLLATAIDEIGDLTEDARIVRGAIMLGSHVRRKEWAGQERSTGSMGLTEGRFTPATLYSMVRMRTIQDSQGATFRRNAPQALVEYAESTLKPTLDDMLKLRNLIVEFPFTNSLG